MLTRNRQGTNNNVLIVAAPAKARAIVAKERTMTTVGTRNCEHSPTRDATHSDGRPQWTELVTGQRPGPWTQRLFGD
jgi:hypothetical protein